LSSASPAPGPSPAGAIAAFYSTKVTGQVLKTSPATTSLDELAILPRLARVVEREAETLAVSRDEAFVLLSQCKWSGPRLEERFFEDSDALRAKLGAGAGPCPPEARRPGAALACPITFEDARPDEVDACACGHWVSAAAWRGYLEQAITHFGAGIVNTRCPTHADTGCTQLVPPRLFLTHLGRDKVARYREGVARCFVANDASLKFCPAAGCSQAVEYKGGEERDVLCAGGHAFCFACSATDEAHGPASCVDVGAWKKREVDDGENSKWLIAHTKPCPKCTQPIEKNTGWSVRRRPRHSPTRPLAAPHTPPAPRARPRAAPPAATI